MFYGSNLAEKLNGKQLVESEEFLISQSKSGDSKAFKRLYELYCGKVFALCLRMSGNTNKANDLTQDVFVRVWKNINSFRGESMFSTWIYRIAVNVVLIDKRTENNFTKRFLSIHSSIINKLSSIQNNNKIDLENAISKLPKKAKLIFIMHDIEGYKHEEIGEILKISEGTSKAQLHRARKILREELLK